MEEMNERFPLNTPERCQIILKVLNYAESRRDGMERLEQFLKDNRFLFGVSDVMEWTGWSENHIRRLCQMNKLPHIPGKKIKFVYSDVVKALSKMQRGGEYRKRSATPKPRKEKP